MTAHPAQSTFGSKGVPLPAPPDFDEVFVRIGRLGCEEYYKAEGLMIDAWLRERGKQRLIDERHRIVKQAEADRNAAKRLSRRDMTKILESAYHVPTGRYINPAVAQRAAHYLRIMRNGGWVISPMPGGLWRLGQRVVSAAELVELAKAKGFGANLSDAPNTKVD